MDRVATGQENSFLGKVREFYFESGKIDILIFEVR